MWADFVQDPDVKNVHNNIHVDDQIDSLEDKSPLSILYLTLIIFFEEVTYFCSCKNC